MATTINSTALDFANIKSNLKTYLQNTTEFADYDFEASGLSNILDVLAYNTHINGLTTNFALNESFLGTAQLRSSVVSLATGIGYVPDTATSAKATVGLTLNLSGVTGRPSTLNLPTNFRFSAPVDDITYTFQTREVMTATDDGSGAYNFKTTDGSDSIPIFEGTVTTKTFNVGEFNAADVYIIPDENLDADTAIVRVVDGTSTTVYTNITAATVINSSSTIYILKEAPNGFYQLSFGGNGILGVAPAAGNTITVEYLSVKGSAANTAKVFTAIDAVTVLASPRTLSAPSTKTAAIGGDEKETIASIRTHAPSIIELVKQLAIVSFNIEFADPIETFVETELFYQINPLLTSLSINTITESIKTIISNYFIANTGKFGKAFRRSALLSLIDDTSNAVLSSRMNVRMQQRISPTLNVFNNFTLTFPGAIQVPAAVAVPTDADLVVKSNTFKIDGTNCRILNESAPNVASSKLQIVSSESGTVIVDNIGSYNSNSGLLNIVGFRPTAFLGSATEIKLGVKPANQSVLAPERQNIIKYDESLSTISAVTTEADN